MLACTALIGMAAVAGCGGDEESPVKKGRTFSSANERPDVFMRRTARLIATANRERDCAQLDAVNQRSYFRVSCPTDPKLRKSMASFKLLGTKEYGTGAVVDYKSGEVKDGASILLFVGPDRNWGIARFGLLTEPSTKTSDEESQDAYEETIDAYLSAVRDRDCAAFREAKFISPEVKEKDICSKLFADTEDLAQRLKAHPGVEPRYEGGNETYGFYSFETTKPEENSTISIVKVGDDAQVLDVAPSPTRRQQRAIIKLAREQAAGKDSQVETSKSRKAD